MLLEQVGPSVEDLRPLDRRARAPVLERPGGRRTARSTSSAPASATVRNTSPFAGLTARTSAPPRREPAPHRSRALNVTSCSQSALLRIRRALASSAHHLNQPPSISLAVELEEQDPLPGSEAEHAVADGDRLAGRPEHIDMQCEWPLPISMSSSRSRSRCGDPSRRGRSSARSARGGAGEPRSPRGIPARTR